MLTDELTKVTVAEQVKMLNSYAALLVEPKSSALRAVATAATIDQGAHVALDARVRAAVLTRKRSRVQGETKCTR